MQLAMNVKLIRRTGRDRGGGKGRGTAHTPCSRNILGTPSDYETDLYQLLCYVLKKFSAQSVPGTFSERVISNVKHTEQRERQRARRAMAYESEK